MDMNSVLVLLLFVGYSLIIYSLGWVLGRRAVKQSKLVVNDRTLDRYRTREEIWP